MRLPLSVERAIVEFEDAVQDFAYRGTYGHQRRLESETNHDRTKDTLREAIRDAILAGVLP